MYLRVVTIKCPNQTAKKALKLLSKQVATEQMKVGLIKETVVDISETNFLNVKYWISKSHFEKGRINWQKVSQEYNCLLYTSPSPRDRTRSRMPSSA